MIHWGLVIHGGIDGFSRTVVFLKCSDNNRAATVLVAFNKGVELYDIPQKLRTDLGGENVAIWRLMVHHHSSNSSVITGSSVHNERIERLWRDVPRSVSSIFISLFRSLEEEGKLDSLNAVDIFCLHWVFLPIINKTLEEFRESWNNHPLSSEHNLTPNQLFCQGILNQDPALSDQCSSILQVPVSVTVPSDSKFKPCAILKTTLQALSSVTIIDDAVAKYIEVGIIVGHHVRYNCNLCV